MLASQCSRLFRLAARSRNLRGFSNHSSPSFWAARPFWRVIYLGPRYRTSFVSQYHSLRNDPTIYALSTAPGRAAIAIIRCSGSQCLSIYESLCPGEKALQPRRATVRTLLEPVTQEVLDASALVLYFPGPNTATGENILEFHVHGGSAIVKAVLAAIPKTKTIASSSIRYAEPGEFTRRAFYNNRLDLTQVEALGNTLSAETEQQRRLAVHGMSNTLHDRYEKWRNHLLYARGELEALIDFSEDQHFDESAEDFVHSISGQIKMLVNQIRATMRNAAKGELLRHGIKIALLGEPNAGKSSLLNAIVGREAAIVSSEAGTTRDVIEVNVDINGYFCKFNDLAGLRSQATAESTIGEIEREGIARAKAHARDADIVIVVISCRDDTGTIKLDDNAEILEFVNHELQEHQKILFAISKSDLADGNIDDMIEELGNLLKVNLKQTHTPIPVSCIRDAGLQGLLARLTAELSQLTAAENIETGRDQGNLHEASLGTTTRQQALLEQTASELQNFLNDIGQHSAEDSVNVVLAAERLRIAAQCLAKITGRGESGDVEEVLGVVFEKFCVGK